MNAVHTTRTHMSAKPYPNAAEPKYFLDRLADGVLAVAVCIGIVSILFVLGTMF